MVLLLLTALAAEPQMLPTPFTAEQLRDAMPTGTHIVLRVTDSEGTSQLDWTVEENTPEGMVWRSLVDLPGDADPPPERKKAAWVELQKHAEFPASDARRRRTRFSTPWGVMTGWRYDVREKTEAGVVRSRFWFADEMPGPPVRMMVVDANGDHSELVQIAREPMPRRLVAGPVPL